MLPMVYREFDAKLRQAIEIPITEDNYLQVLEALCKGHGFTAIRAISIFAVGIALPTSNNTIPNLDHHFWNDWCLKWLLEKYKLIHEPDQQFLYAILRYLVDAIETVDRAFTEKFGVSPMMTREERKNVYCNAS